MLSAHQIAEFFNFNISKTGRYKVDFLHAGTYLLKLQIVDVILDAKVAIKTIRSQELKEF